MISNNTLPSQPTLQFIDVPEWFINREDGHASYDDYKNRLSAHDEPVNASVSGKIVYSSAGRVMHIVEYEKRRKK